MGASETCGPVFPTNVGHALKSIFAWENVATAESDREAERTREKESAGITQDGRPGLRDEDLSDDGRFLYAIDADQGQIVAWSVDEQGHLSMAGSWGGVPTTVAGLAAV